MWRPGASRDEVVRLAVDSLYDAADEDSATGGPDMTRRLYPVVLTATADGVARLPDEQVGRIAEAVLASRMENPGGRA